MFLKAFKPIAMSIEASICEDSGRTREYWTLLVLQKLMEAVEDEELRQGGILGRHHAANSFYPEPYPKSLPQYANQFLPCHYFDLICGTGTAAYVHPLRMTAS
jgi:hypothetical protein